MRGSASRRFIFSATSKLSSWTNFRSGVKRRSIAWPSRPRRKRGDAVQRRRHLGRVRAAQRLDEADRVLQVRAHAHLGDRHRDAGQRRVLAGPPRAGSPPARGAPARRRAAGAATARGKRPGRRVGNSGWFGAWRLRLAGPAAGSNGARGEAGLLVAASGQVQRRRAASGVGPGSAKGARHEETLHPSAHRYLAPRRRGADPELLHPRRGGRRAGRLPAGLRPRRRRRRRW